MGWGDAIIATGLARGAAERGRRIAFGNGKGILWSQEDHEIFRSNPNVASPGYSWRADEIQWIHYYKGHRLYGQVFGGHWKFVDFQCPEGEIFFSEDEIEYGRARAEAAVILEPRVKKRGACAGDNKQWPVERYQTAADMLQSYGWSCAQLVPRGVAPLLTRVRTITTPDFRSALAVLSHVELYIGPEGGLHHGSAAVGTPAVVIFGGFNTPRATGYSWHHNITVGEPCGTIAKCDHCRKAMASISVEQVVEAALLQLKKEAA